jgi:hypothetical protein
MANSAVFFLENKKNVCRPPLSLSSQHFLNGFHKELFTGKPFTADILQSLIGKAQELLGLLQ